jgi:hypothetical protein
MSHTKQLANDSVTVYVWRDKYGFLHADSRRPVKHADYVHSAVFVQGDLDILSTLEDTNMTPVQYLEFDEGYPVKVTMARATWDFWRNR